MRLQVLHLPTPEDESQPRFALVFDEVTKPEPLARPDFYKSAKKRTGACAVFSFSETVEVL